MPDKGGPPSGNRRMRIELDLPAARIGFGAPPFDVRVKFIRNGGRLALLVWGTERAPARIASWVESCGARAEMVVGPRDGRVSWFLLDGLPAAWEELVARVDVLDLAIGRDGEARLAAEGTSEDLRWLADQAGTSGAPRPRVRGMGRARDQPWREGPTARQHEALATAEAHGYYDVRRATNLAELAQTMGISSAALSELLRRAEAHIVRLYLRADMPLDQMRPQPRSAGPQQDEDRRDERGGKP